MLKLIRVVHRRAFLRITQKLARAGGRAGKVTLVAVLSVTTLSFLVFGAFFNVQVPKVNADDVSTSVTVLNTPPQWTVDAEEAIASATSTPTNAGAQLRWIGTASDSNNENYYLLICKTSASPTPNSNAAPSCGGGIGNQWAVSAATPSDSQASAATTTKETFPFNVERNDWYAWICDANASLAQCNATLKQGNGDVDKSSPFVINHPPVFSSISNNSPANPGGSITWTSVAHDNDTIRGGDTVKLSVCKAADYATTTSSCGAGGTWAASTLQTSDPATTTAIVIPTQDRNYSAFVYISDDNNLAATSTFQAFNSVFFVSNVSPTISAATISLVDPRTSTTTGLLTLFVPHATSGPYQVQFQVSDNNSCLNASSTNEIATSTTDIYRSGIGANSCRASGDFNTNSCYPNANTQTVITCSQDAGSCSGATDTTATWTCTFHLWYNADATDGSGSTDTQFFSENWLATVRVADNNGTTSPFTEAVTGNDVASFLAFDVTQTSIGYGGLQPGQQNDPLASTTNLLAYGNVGLDENLYGDTMCTTWTGADSCDVGGPDPTRKITVDNQKYATSSVAYASAFAFALTSSSTPSSLGIHVPKTTATSSPETRDTYWGINIPLAITVAGAYSGQNTIIATKSSPTFW